MIKLYRASRDAQIEWILENKGKWVAINAIGVALVLGYMFYSDRKWEREFDENFPAEPQKEETH